MKIKVINPNTTLSMTKKIEEAAKNVAEDKTQIVAVSPEHGPVSIECHYDEAVAALGVVDEVRKGEKDKCDGYIIACFGDPGLLAAREVATGPVVGIAEAAMHMASFLATGFSVVTTLSRTCVIAEHLARQYGMIHFCKNIRGTDLEVLNLEDPKSNAYKIILNECKKALKEDKSGAIVLGCAGMADLCTNLTKELKVPVIDGVAAAVKMVEGMVTMGLKTAKIGDLANPSKKKYIGITEKFAP